MSRVIEVLASKWFLSFLGVALLGVLVWIGGPLVAIGDSRPFEPVLTRALIAGGLFLIWAVAFVWSVIAARRRNAAMIEAIAAPEGPTPEDEEVDRLRERMVQALETLKRSRLGRGRQWLYQLPWYLMIGPPGAGKTTALINSGLDFPLAEDQAERRMRGIGGTRDCDWWFTDQAVLIDTAGRYTTQDSDGGVSSDGTAAGPGTRAGGRDRAGWQGFLELLKKHRPRQPVNGVLVCISLAEVALASAAERDAHARALRRRLRELTEQLDVRVPVYVLVTKADLLAGFTAFFDDLDAAGRAQVWGMTFPFDDEVESEGESGSRSAGDTGRSAGAVAHFDAEFDRLIDRLNARVIDRMHAEPDGERRALIHGFPAQMASVRAPLGDFLRQVFQPTRLAERPLLRGVYLTSGTQEGTPFDRLTGAMARSFGLDRATQPPMTGRGRAFFLADLLNRVVFAEAGVVTTDPAAARRRRLIRHAGFATAAVVAIACVAAWTVSYFGNSRLIDEAAAGIEDYRGAVTPFAETAVADDDLAELSPVLDRLRDVPTGAAEAEAGLETPIDRGFGLDQAPTLSQGTVSAYHRALNRLFLPRLLVRLENQLRAAASPSDVSYTALKVYLMLGAQGPIESEVIGAWMALDWQNRWPGEENAPLRAALQDHLAALLDRPIASVPLDGALVEQVRTLLASQPLAERVYARLVESPAATALPAWTPVDHAGPQAARVLVRRSGKRLSEGIPGIYTYDGFHNTFLPALEAEVRATAEEGWVLSEKTRALTDEEVAKLARDTLQLYYDDYVGIWNGLIADIDLAAFQSDTHAVESLNVLSSPRSPMVTLLKAVADETRLATPRGDATAGGGDTGQAGNGRPSGSERAGDAVALEAESRMQRQFGFSGRIASLLLRDAASDALAGGNGGRAQELPGAYVEERFKELDGFVTAGPGGQAPVDAIVDDLGQLYRAMSRGRMAVDGPGGGAAAEAELAGLAQQLSLDAGRAPDVMRGWAETIAERASSRTIGDARARLNEAWALDGRDLCRTALAGRYPFDRGSRQDVKLDDFARIFAGGGILDGFFRKELAPYVETGGRRWSWRKINNADLGIPNAVLADFREAARIRDAFFPGGGTVPDIGFDLVPVSLTPSAARVVVEVNGQTAAYDHGPVRPMPLRWPGNGPQQVRVTFIGTDGTPAGGTSLTGPWALFRLIDRSEVRQIASDRFEVTFRAGQNAARFEVRAGSVLNPFSLDDLRSFSCPRRF
ncbi:type VI secretion system membrane subunit TssM (plasmid) [Tistrella mobilis]|uniref:type VI secretion system membrane subunit TssM n=1 Tax=Tistrella mobilis TaxID=171437 RepID=UPI0035570200